MCTPSAHPSALFETMQMGVLFENPCALWALWGEKNCIVIRFIRTRKTIILYKMHNTCLNGIYIYIHLYIQMCIPVCIVCASYRHQRHPVCIYIYIYTHVWYIYICMHMYIYIYHTCVYV